MERFFGYPIPALALLLVLVLVSVLSEVSKQEIRPKQSTCNMIYFFRVNISNPYFGTHGVIFSTGDVS